MQAGSFFPLLAALVAFSPLAHGHGVERGSIQSALSASGMNADTQDAVSEAIISRCDFTGAEAVVGSTPLPNEAVGPAPIDFPISVKITVKLKDNSFTEIYVEAYQYEGTNSLLWQPNAITIRSSICR